MNRTINDLLYGGEPIRIEEFCLQNKKNDYHRLSEIPAYPNGFRKYLICAVRIIEDVLQKDTRNNPIPRRRFFYARQANNYRFFCMLRFSTK